MEFKIYLGFNYNQYREGWFVRWNRTMASFTNDQNDYGNGKTLSAVECLTEYTKLINHYQPLSDNGTITDWKIEIHYGQNNIVDTDFVKDKIIEEIKSLGAKASFDPRPLTDNEKLAMFYMSRYISMQEIQTEDKTITFRKFVEQYLPSSMQTSLNDIMRAFTNLGLEILGNDKDTLVDDEPYVDVKVTNGGI